MSNTQDSMETRDQEALIRELIERVRRGDLTAFDELVRQFQAPMFNLAYRMVNNREDAADLTQEIFVKVYRSLDKFSGRSKFSTWLYAVAANTCRSGLRRLKRVSSREVMHLNQDVDTEDGTLHRELPDPGDAPDQGVQRREVQGVIEAAIAALPEEWRIVVVLRDIQGMTYDEIATTIGCEIGTVKSRLSRARSRLKERLTRKGLICAVKP